MVATSTSLRSLSAPRSPFVWAVVGAGVGAVYCLGVAQAYGFAESAIENGPQEAVEVALLAMGAAVFLWSAVVLRRPGAPALTFLAMTAGVMALRELDIDDASALGSYLSGHAARWHWVALMLVLTGLVSRRPSSSVRASLRLIRAIGPTLAAAAALVVLGSVAEEVGDRLATTPVMDMVLLWLEETLELCGYAALLAVALWLTRRNVPDAPSAVAQTPTPR